MKHADEGILHAWLDGELTTDEAAELERHLSVCVSCRALLAEAKGFAAEADDLVLALDEPGALKPLPAPRRVPWSALAWAAMVVLALGTGYALRPALGPRAASDMLGRERTEPIVPAPAPSDPAPAAAEVPTAPRGAAPPRQAPAAVPPRSTTGELSTANGAGAPAAVQDAALLAEREDRAAAPTPMAAAEPPAPAAGTPLPASRLATVDGAPVDTTTLQLSFGPRASAPPQRITLDEAVTRLGGTIQLIDGLAPQRVEVLAGVDVAGADPDREVIRVYYEEPDLGLVTLDQQRPAPSFATRDRARRLTENEGAAGRAQVATLERPRGATAARQRTTPQTITWRADGVWLSLTSRLPGDQLAQLQARVK